MTSGPRSAIVSRFAPVRRRASTESCIARCWRSSPNRRLSYSWRGGSTQPRGYGADLDTVVTWTLTPSPSGGTPLKLDHDGFAPEQEPTFKILKQGWTTGVVPSLGRVLDSLA